MTVFPMLLMVWQLFGLWKTFIGQLARCLKAEKKRAALVGRSSLDVQRIPNNLTWPLGSERGAIAQPGPCRPGNNTSGARGTGSTVSGGITP